MATSYDNPGGWGPRHDDIIVTTTLGSFSGSPISNLVSGEPSATGYSNIGLSRWSPTSLFNWSSHWIQFDFGMPVVIDEAILYHNCNAQPTGRAKWQGSNDGSTWTDIGTDFVVLANTSAPTTMTELNGNTTAYRYYRLRGVSGSYSLDSGYWQEITFKIDGFEPRSSHLPSYLNYGGWGNRAGVVSASSNFLNYMTTTPANLVNGSFADSVTGSWANSINANWAGNWIQFDFLTPIVVTEAQLFMNTGSFESGTAKWQGSNDASSWVDVSSNFTFNVSAPARRILGDMSGNTTAYRYYRILGVSGTKSSAPWWREIWFRTHFLADDYTPARLTQAAALVVEKSSQRVRISQSALLAVSVEAGDPIPNRLTQAAILVVSAPEVAQLDTRVSQVPVLALAKSDANGVRVSQVPILVLAEQKQPGRATQIPVLTLIRQKPVLLPKPVIPEIPVTEIWKWKTTLSEAETSKEQRQRLLDEPRYVLDMTILAGDQSERRYLYNMISRYLRTVFLYPFFQYGAPLNSSASAGDTKLLCTTANTDVRSGEYVALFSNYENRLEFVKCTSVDADGFNLDSPLPYDLGPGWWACPAINFKLVPLVGIDMDSVSGSLKLTIESVDNRDFVVSDDPELTFFENFLVVKDRPIAPQTEEFNFGVEWFDNDTSVPSKIERWAAPHPQSTRVYSFNRWTKISYWRSVANYFKGRQKVGLFPTFFNDLPVLDPVDLNSKSFITSNVDFLTFWQEPVYRYLMIETENGVKYRRIANVEPMFNENGDPEKLNITLTQSFGNNPRDVMIKSVSYMYMARLDTDEVKLSHYDVDTVIQFSIRSVNQ